MTSEQIEVLQEMRERFMETAALDDQDAKAVDALAAALDTLGRGDADLRAANAATLSLTNAVRAYRTAGHTGAGKEVEAEAYADMCIAHDTVLNYLEMCPSFPLPAAAEQDGGGG